MLGGRVDPPSFNLRNALMVGKHVHATVITRLHQYVRDEGRSKEERQSTEIVLQNTLPLRVAHYLFENGDLRAEVLDLSEFRELIATHLDDLTTTVEGVFQQGWPTVDGDVGRHLTMDSEDNVWLR